MSAAVTLMWDRPSGPNISSGITAALSPFLPFWREERSVDVGLFEIQGPLQFIILGAILLILWIVLVVYLWRYWRNLWKRALANPLSEGEIEDHARKKIDGALKVFEKKVHKILIAELEEGSKRTKKREAGIIHRHLDDSFSEDEKKVLAKVEAEIASEKKRMQGEIATFIKTEDTRLRKQYRPMLEVMVETERERMMAEVMQQVTEQLEKDRVKLVQKYIAEADKELQKARAAMKPEAQIKFKAELEKRRKQIEANLKERMSQDEHLLQARIMNEMDHYVQREMLLRQGELDAYANRIMAQLEGENLTREEEVRARMALEVDRQAEKLIEDQKVEIEKTLKAQRPSDAVVDQRVRGQLDSYRAKLRAEGKIELDAYAASLRKDLEMEIQIQHEHSLEEMEKGMAAEVQKEVEQKKPRIMEKLELEKRRAEADLRSRLAREREEMRKKLTERYSGELELHLRVGMQEEQKDLLAKIRNEHAEVINEMRGQLREQEHLEKAVGSEQDRHEKRKKWIEMQLESASSRHTDVDRRRELESRVHERLQAATRMLGLVVGEIRVSAGPPLEVYLGYRGTSALVPKREGVEERVRQFLVPVAPDLMRKLKLTVEALGAEEPTTIKTIMPGEQGPRFNVD